MNPRAHKDIRQRSAKARELLRSCCLCPRRCRVNRLEGQTGYCGLDARARCFREMVGFNEEKELNPSHQVYFTGCNLTCGFCTVAEWNQDPAAADEFNAPELSRVIARRRREGARTLNLLGGEPSVNLYGILKLLSKVSPRTRVVWNSNIYFAPAVGDLLDGVVDVYLADLKCGSRRCASRLLGASDYLDVVRNNLCRLRPTADMIVRHLILPGHRRCCLEPSLRWLAREMLGVKFSLRGNYVPPAEPGPAPRGYLGAEEFQRAKEFAEALGLNMIE